MTFRSGLIFDKEATLILKLKGPISAADINSAIHVHGQAMRRRTARAAMWRRLEQVPMRKASM